MPRRAVKNVLKSIESFKGKEDGTYDLQTSTIVEYSTGYQVSFVRPEAFDHLSAEDWDVLTNYCSTYLDSPPHIGVYLGDVEVSFHSASLDKAVEIMEIFNQESILDWSKKQSEPEQIDDWFISNRNFNQSKVIEYEEILDKIL